MVMHRRHVTMSHDQNDEITSEQLSRVLQKALLQNYPNPDRIGCRGSEILREMAERKLPHEHPFWEEHVSHCSPCYKVFLDFRNEALARWDREDRNRKISQVTVLAAIVLLVAGAIYVSMRGRVSPSPPATANHIQETLPPQPQNPPKPGSSNPPEQTPAEPKTEPRKPGAGPPVLSASLNFENESTTRELPGGNAPQDPEHLQQITRGRVRLIIYLPLGSEAGD